MNHFHAPCRFIAFATTLVIASSATAHDFTPWGDPQDVASINTMTAAEGCPIESPDGLNLFIASNRSAPGAQGKLDVYRARRTAVHQSWGCLLYTSRCV